LTGATSGTALWTLASDLILLGADVHFHIDGYRLVSSRGEVPLTQRETRLLATLVRNPCCYLSVDELAPAVAAGDRRPTDHSLEESIRTLRRKVREAGADPCVIRNRRGAGYAFHPEMSH
jgi:DNA-binding response OmpR family regulator